MKQDKSWHDFWTRFSEDGYDYTNLLPENRRLLIEIAGLVGNGKKVLDAVCGTGNLTLLLAENNHVTGIDFNESMLNIAAGKTSHASSVILWKGDVTKLPFKASTFDAVTSVNVIYHLDNPQDAIKEAWRVLKPNGLLVITSPLKGLSPSEEFAAKVIKDCKEGNVDMKKFKKLKEYNKILIEQGGLKFAPAVSEIKDMLASNGFNAINIKTVYYGINFLASARKA